MMPWSIYSGMFMTWIAIVPLLSAASLTLQFKSKGLFPPFFAESFFSLWNYYDFYYLPDIVPSIIATPQMQFSKSDVSLVDSNS